MKKLMKTTVGQACVLMLGVLLVDANAVMGQSDVDLNFFAPEVFVQEELTQVSRRFDFDLATVPAAVPNEDLQDGVNNAMPGIPFLVFETVERVLDDTQQETSQDIETLACTAFLPGGATRICTPESIVAEPAIFGEHYGGDPDNFFTWFALTNSHVSVNIFPDVHVTDFYTETTTQYFLTLLHPCDFNENGKVDFADFLMFSGVFGQSAEEAGAKFDKDSSGTVDFADFLQFSANFGTEVGSTPVPETSIVWTPIVLVGCLLLRNKRETHATCNVKRRSTT